MLKLITTVKYDQLLILKLVSFSLRISWSVIARFLDCVSVRIIYTH